MFGFRGWLSLLPVYDRALFLAGERPSCLEMLDGRDFLLSEYFEFDCGGE
jgi:hypothetical protein